MKNVLFVMKMWPFEEERIFMEAELSIFFMPHDPKNSENDYFSHCVTLQKINSLYFTVQPKDFSWHQLQIE